MDDKTKFALAAMLVGGFVVWFINSQPHKASTPRLSQATLNEIKRNLERLPSPEPSRPSQGVPKTNPRAALCGRVRVELGEKSRVMQPEARLACGGASGPRLHT
jgi:hypothetical protein